MLVKNLKSLFSGDLFKATSIYTVSGILTKAIPFLLLPVFTHYLSTSDYGILSLVSSSILALAPFVKLGITDLATVEFKKRKREDYKIFQGTALTLSFLLFVFTLFLTFSFTKYLSQISTIPVLGILLIPLLTYFNFSNDLLITLVRNDEKRILYVVLNVSKTFIELSLAIILIVIFKMNWLGRINGMLISGLLFTLFLFYYISKENGLKLNLNVDNIKSIVQFGMATIPLYFMTFSLYNADKFVVSKVLDSKEQVGLYTIPFQIAYIINVFETAFYTAFLPRLYDWLKEDSTASKIKIVKSIYISTLLILISGIALYFFSPLIYRFFIDVKYDSSINLLPYFIVSFVLWNVFANLLPLIFYFKKTKYLFWVNSVTILFNLVALYFLTKQFGVIGACYANILSFSFLAFLIVFFANKTYRLPWLYFTRLPRNNR